MEHEGALRVLRSFDSVGEVEGRRRDEPVRAQVRARSAGRGRGARHPQRGIVRRVEAVDRVEATVKGLTERDERLDLEYRVRGLGMRDEG